MSRLTSARWSGRPFSGRRGRWPGKRSWSTLPRTCRCCDLDAVLFEQVLVNLLDNAAKYAPPGSTVTIAGRRSEDGVEITVIDEGPGLPRRGPGAGIRQVLPGEPGRPATGRDGPGACDLPRLRGGARGQDPCRQPPGRIRSRVHGDVPARGFIVRAGGGCGMSGGRSAPRGG